MSAAVIDRLGEDFEVLIKSETVPTEFKNWANSLMLYLSKRDDFEVSSLRIETRAQIDDFLKESGIPSHFHGFAYLSEAIFLGLKNPDTLSSLSSIMYPRLGLLFGISPAGIEKGISRALWSAQTTHFAKEVFGNLYQHPSSAKFIFAAVNYLKSYNG